MAKFKTAGTCLEIKLGSDAANYYSKTWTAADLSTGWNWCSSGYTAVNALTETGTVAGNIDTFIIEITTNNATDTFVAGDVVYDLLRTWQTSDLFASVDTITQDETNKEVSVTASLSSVQANGFLISEFGLFNNDTTKLMCTHDVFTAKSKSSTEEIQFEQTDRVV